MKTALAIWIAAIAVVFAHPAGAQQTNTLPTELSIGGHTYKDITWGTVTPSAVSIQHSSGVASVPLASLPPDLQKRFGYDPEKAARYQAAERERSRQLAEQEAARKRAQAERARQSEVEKSLAESCEAATSFRAKVLQVTTDGLLVSVFYERNAKEQELVSKSGQMPDWFLVGYPGHQQLAEDEIATFRAYRSGVFTYQTVLGASRSVQRWVYCGEFRDRSK